MNRPRDINIVIGIGIFAVVAFTTYWLIWFAAPGMVQSRMPGDPGFDIYEAYEMAFILPDAFVTMAALVGVIGLWSMKDWGVLSMLLAAGGQFSSDWRTCSLTLKIICSLLSPALR